LKPVLKLARATQILLRQRQIEACGCNRLDEDEDDEKDIQEESKVVRMRRHPEALILGWKEESKVVWMRRQLPMHRQPVVHILGKETCGTVHQPCSS